MMTFKIAGSTVRLPEDPHLTRDHATIALFVYRRLCRQEAMAGWAWDLAADAVMQFGSTQKAMQDLIRESLRYGAEVNGQTLFFTVVEKSPGQGKTWRVIMPMGESLETVSRRLCAPENAAREALSQEFSDLSLSAKPFSTAERLEALEAAIMTRFDALEKLLAVKDLY